VSALVIVLVPLYLLAGTSAAVLTVLYCTLLVLWYSNGTGTVVLPRVVVLELLLPVVLVLILVLVLVLIRVPVVKFLVLLVFKDY
jgi:hypothetical protein